MCCYEKIYRTIKSKEIYAKKFYEINPRCHSFLYHRQVQNKLESMSNTTLYGHV
jgi:hypothetical protein